MVLLLLFATISKEGSKTIFPDVYKRQTLLNILAKIEPYEEGSISYQGQELKQIKQHHFFKRELGYLFQNFGLLENETIAKNLDLGLIGQKLTKKEKKQQEEEVLKKVGLAYLALDQKIYELSGGEAQRVALAKVILKDPPLILADELTACLLYTSTSLQLE